MQSPSALTELMDALKCLPGVGPRSAQRMAYHLLQQDRKGAERLSFALSLALSNLTHCQRCNNYSETDICTMCLDDSRNTATLCVVEMPADLLMMEQARCHEGLYYVLQGRLSPLDGIGPEDIRLSRLINRVKDGLITEVILATNYTAEGEATAYYLTELLKRHNVQVSRIARGMPMGGEIEHVDPATLAQAVYERKTL